MTKMGVLIYEFWGKIFNVCLIFIYLFYMWLFSPIVVENFRIQHRNRWNALLSFGSLLALAILTFLSLIDPIHFDPILVYPFNYYIVVFWAFWLLVNVINNAIHEQIKAHYQSRPPSLPSSPSPLTEKKSRIPRVEWERKTIHAITALAALAFLVGPVMFNWAYQSFYVPSPQYYSAAIHSNVMQMGDLDNFPRSAMIHYSGLLLVLISAITAQFDAELFLNRKPNYEYVFKRSFEKTRRSEEVGSIDSHIPMILGIVLGIIILIYNAPYDSDPRYLNASNAMILPTVFADMTACIIGKAWGRRKWWFDPRKSYLGSTAGVLVTAAITIPLVGIPLGLVSVGVFLLADLIFPLWNLTDNYTYPMLCAIIYRIAFTWISPMVLLVDLLPA